MKEYERISGWLSRYEKGFTSCAVPLADIADRISWAWKFRKITRAQMNELSDRAVMVSELFGTAL